MYRVQPKLDKQYLIQGNEGKNRKEQKKQKIPPNITSILSLFFAESRALAQLHRLPQKMMQLKLKAIP